jgi:hypothetical protein
MSESKQNKSTLSKTANTASEKAIRFAAKAASQAVSKAITAAASTIPVIGTATGALLGKVAGYVTEKIAVPVLRFSKKILDPKNALAGLAVIGGLGAAFITGIASAISTITGILIFSPLVLAVIIAFIMFIINSGAYIVPPAPDIESNLASLPVTSTTISNPYIEVTKAANPPGPFQNGSVPNPITFTITVRAKQGALTNIRFQNTCLVTKQGSNPNCTPPPPPPAPSTIDPGTPFTSTYDMNFTSSDYSNSLITDTFTVSATVANVGDQTAASNASIKIGNPPISCPIANGRVNDGSYTGNENRGHGSNRYWEKMGTPYCRWSLPETSRCLGPTNAGNKCSNEKITCPYYGYAMDIFPGSLTVTAPTVLGQSVIWNYSGEFSNRDAGWSRIYKSGPYTIVLTHMVNDGSTYKRAIPSGNPIGILFHQTTRSGEDNTHLHLEFQINGVYQRPEDYFCR